MPKPSTPDFLAQHLRDLPYFRALLRAVEARFYQDIPLPAPTLDVGCGDGHFASLAFDHPLEVGLDPWWPPLLEAAGRKSYQNLLRADAGRMPFPDGHFASAVSNSVLEHIPHLQQVLQDTARVLQPGAQFIFCVPNHQFLPNLSIGRGLDVLGLKPLGNAYRAFFNRISRHHHCDPPEVWQQRLEQAGFELVAWWHYFSPAALKTLEWGHYFGLPSLLTKKLAGRWLLSTADWNLNWLAARLRRHYQPSLHPQGAYTFYIARRQ